MSKKSAKIAATYFVTIITALVLIGGVGYFALNTYLNSENDKESSIKPVGMENAVVTEEYVPEEGYGQTALFVYEAEKRSSGVCFMLTRFIPYEKKLVMVPLQSDLCIDYNGKSNTLYEFYRLGGITEAVSAVEELTDINIEKYMKFNRESFTLFSNFCGNVTYDVPYNLIYENPETGESTVMKEGGQTLDAVSLRKLITYPEYRGGEEYRAKVMGTVGTELINLGSNGLLKSGTEAVFKEVMNSDVETNITAYDFDELEPAFKYVMDNNTSPAQLVIPSGTYNANNCYVLDDTFIQALPRWLLLE